MIQLDSLVLPDNIIWQNRHGFTGISGSMERTLDGSQVVFEQEIQGQPIDLVAYEYRGWLTFAQVQQLEQLAGVKDAEYQLTFDSKVIMVRFRHEDGALDLSPVRELPTDYAAGDFFYGRIKLMEI